MQIIAFKRSGSYLPADCMRTHLQYQQALHQYHSPLFCKKTIFQNLKFILNICYVQKKNLTDKTQDFITQ